MDYDSVERIRSATFTPARRGYDKREVDRFLSELADWLETGGDDDTRSELVRRELERIGEQTAKILTEAHEVAQAIRTEAEHETRQALVDANLNAEAMRSSADEYAEQSREEADTYARKVRADADSYDAEARAEADAYAEQTRGEAETYAGRIREEADAAVAEQRQESEREGERIVADANRRKGEIEKVISDLEQRRDAVVAELERLASGIRGTATQHRAPSDQSRSEEAPSDEVDDSGQPARSASSGEGSA